MAFFLLHIQLLSTLEPCFGIGCVLPHRLRLKIRLSFFRKQARVPMAYRGRGMPWEHGMEALAYRGPRCGPQVSALK